MVGGALRYPTPQAHYTVAFAETGEQRRQREAGREEEKDGERGDESDGQTQTIHRLVSPLL